MRGPELKVQAIPLETLRANPRNPRIITEARFEELVMAIEADPEMLQARPVIALPDGTVIAGNMRLRAAERLGWNAVPTVLVDLDPERARLWALRDNNEYGTWDDDALAELLHDLSEDGVDLELTGFSDEEVTKLLDSVAIPLEAADEVPPLPEEPVTKRDDVYVLGQHRLLCGDATDPEAWERLMQGERADALWTDPPYGVSYQHNLSRNEAAARRRRKDGKDLVGDAVSEDQLRELLSSALGLAVATLRPGGAVYVAAPAGPRVFVFHEVLRALGVWRQSLVWAKGQFVLGRHDYHYAHETVFYGWKPGGKHRFSGGRNQDTVWEIARPKRSEEHPTMKPVALVSRAIENSTGRGALVLDPFVGSGTTLIAAEQLGRRCYAMDIDPRYVDIAVSRWETCTGQEARLEGAVTPPTSLTCGQEALSLGSRAETPSGPGSGHTAVHRADVAPPEGDAP